MGLCVGYKVFVPEPAALSANTDEPILLHTYLQVREDALNLFGFTDVEELAMFELLLGVNGVGPKVALATLSVLNPDMLRMAVSAEEPAMIARVPGVGKRTAEKIVLELRDKVKTCQRNPISRLCHRRGQRSGRCAHQLGLQRS